MNSLSLHRSIEQTSRHDRRATTAEPRFPRTDYNYQATPQSSSAALSTRQHSLGAYERELRSFRELSKPVTGSGFNWQFAVETTVLGLVGVIVAWPLVSLLVVLAQTARG